MYKSSVCFICTDTSVYVIQTGHFKNSMNIALL